MTQLEIRQSDPSSQARAGVLTTGHGEVRTPAFVPLATKATVRGMLPGEVSGIGYDMVLGNTYHLLLNPGHEFIARRGGLHRFMGWTGPIITDSGGFQVFSMGHGTIAAEIKSRGRDETLAERAGGVISIEEEGVRFRSYVDGNEHFLSPEGSMEVQAALGSDLALAFDECTPFHADREYTARSTERTHRWLTRCVAWHDAHAPGYQLMYGIVQGGVYNDLRLESTQAIASSSCDGIAIGGSLGSDKPQMYEVVGWVTAELDRQNDHRPRHLLGIGEVDDLIHCVRLGIDTFDCAMPTRLGRHGTALVPDPQARWRIDLNKSGFRDADEPLADGCPCPACAAGMSRAYLAYLSRGSELTGIRLITTHNLTFIALLMADLRSAIETGNLDERATQLLAGAFPRTGA
jgi:queuine tRNA-ribosyltransferase